MIPLAQLHESPLNTRQHFDVVKLAELATSMRTSGQLTPLLARPSQLENKPGFELAAGHRRRRAAEAAGMSELMVIVRDLDDRTFLEILTVDNLQREDVHPLEEAQGYRNLLTIDGYDPKQIGERVSKSESYVYDRLTLLKLIPELQELFFANRFSLGHAVLLARQGASVQKKLVEDTDGAGGLWRMDHGHATLGLAKPDDEEGEYAGLRPVTVRELQQWIDTYVRFDTEEESVSQLFPETASTLAAAEEKREKVVPITRNFHVDPQAKDAEGARTYGPSSWKRADGEPEGDRGGSMKPSKTCEYSVIGLVAVGEGRGDTFRVCVDKKRCTVHWAEEIKARNQRERAQEREASSSPGAKSSAPKEQSWEREQRLRKEQSALAKARWAKGGDAVIRAIVPHVKKLVVGGETPATKYFLDVIQDGIYGLRDTGKAAAKVGVGRGTSPADLIRHLIMVALLDRATPDSYNATNEADLQEDLDALKINVGVVKLLDAANPVPKEEPKSKKAAGKPSPKVGTDVAKKPRAKTPAAKKAKPAKKRTAIQDFMKPKQPDTVLAAIVGDKPLPRTEITKKLWQHIKKNGLQDAKERRMINADDKLKALFGGKSQVSMFEMTKLVNKHIEAA